MLHILTKHIHTHEWSTYANKQTKQTPWPESASELFRPSDSSLYIYIDWYTRNRMHNPIINNLFHFIGSVWAVYCPAAKQQAHWPEVSHGFHQSLQLIILTLAALPSRLLATCLRIVSYFYYKLVSETGLCLCLQGEAFIGRRRSRLFEPSKRSSKREAGRWTVSKRSVTELHSALVQ
jgi:hypothetical protein